MAHSNVNAVIGFFQTGDRLTCPNKLIFGDREFDPKDPHDKMAYWQFLIVKVI